MKQQQNEKQWQDRIVGLDRVAPSSLLFHPDTCYFHPFNQQKSTGLLLYHIGWVAPLIVNKDTGYLLDGQMRAALADYHRQKEVPVLYVSIPDKAEEALVVWSFNALARKCLADSDLPFIETTDEEGYTVRTTTSNKSKLDEVTEWLFRQGGAVKSVVMTLVQEGIVKIGDESRKRSAGKKANLEQLESVQYQVRNSGKMLFKVDHSVGYRDIRLYGPKEQINEFIGELNKTEVQLNWKRVA